MADPFAEFQGQQQKPDQEEWTENLNIHLICPECQEFPPNLYDDHAAGDTVCGSCGLVLSQRMVDTRSEWRTFSNDENNDDPSRVGDGANPLLNGSQLETHISYSDNAKSRDLRRAQDRLGSDKSNKALLKGYREIGSICEAHQLPPTVADTAKHLYKLTEDAKMFKGKSPEAIHAGCIFIACRQNDVPRSFREIHTYTKVPKKEIGRTFKALEAFFSKHSGNTPKVAQSGQVISLDFKKTESTDPAELARRYWNRLGMPQNTASCPAKIAENMVMTGVLAGRSPLSCAAACIYMASYLVGSPKTPKKIADVAGVSDGTIRTSYKFLYQERFKLTPDQWRDNIDKLPQA